MQNIVKGGDFIAQMVTADSRSTWNVWKAVLHTHYKRDGHLQLSENGIISLTSYCPFFVMHKPSRNDILESLLKTTQDKVNPN
jgi:hypothetical protein